MGNQSPGQVKVSTKPGAVPFADRLPVSKPYVGIAGIVVLGCMALPEYSLFAAPFLAYTVVAAAALIKNKQLVLRSDISYGTYIHAFPM
jgi:hypothetical protein